MKAARPYLPDVLNTLDIITFAHIFDPLFAAMRDIDTTMMAHVCKDFRQIIMSNYRAKIIPSAVICDTPYITEAQAIYLTAVGYDYKLLLRFGRFDLYDQLRLKYVPEYTLAACKFGRFDKLRLDECRGSEAQKTCPYDLIARAIVSKKRGIVIHLANYFDVKKCHLLMALVYSPKIFDYLMIDYKHLYAPTMNVIKKISETNNFAAIRCIIRHKLPPAAYINQAIDDANLPMLEYIREICPKKLRKQVILLDNAPIYLHLYGAEELISDEEIAKIIINEAADILAFILPRFTADTWGDTMRMIIEMIIVRDSIELMNVFAADFMNWEIIAANNIHVPPITDTDIGRQVLLKICEFIVEFA